MSRILHYEKKRACVNYMQIQFINLAQILIMHCSRSINFICSAAIRKCNLHMQLNKRSLNIRIKENGHKFHVIRLTFLNVFKWNISTFNSSLSLRLSCAISEGDFFFAIDIPVIYRTNIKFHNVENKFYAEHLTLLNQ